VRRARSILIVILCMHCVTAWADYSDADKAYEAGDYAQAFTEYKTFAERGDARAQVNVGWMYYNGEGVRQDKALALVWYHKAAEQGDVTSIFNLAYGYEHGDGVQQDLNESGRWYAKVAEQRGALDRINVARLTRSFVRLNAANTRIAKALADKNNTSEKAGEEARIATAAAAQAKAARLSAAVREEERKGALAAAKWRDLYKRNSGDAVNAPPAVAPAPVEAPAVPEVKKDSVGSAVSPTANLAVEVLRNPRLEKIRRLAMAGDKKAQVALGWAFSSGNGVPEDKVKAAGWYRLAAEKGDLKAQLALGWLYYEGEGCGRDLEESALWYGKAAAQGNGTAGQMLNKIKQLTEK